VQGLEVTFLSAFAAGLLSFVSPCVLPLVPPYLCFLGGLTLQELAEDQEARRWQATRQVLPAALAFVFGFASVFVALGASASAIGQTVSDHFELLSQIAGVIVILLGLHFLGIFRLPLLYREARYHPARKPAGLVGAYFVGLAFAFGWTPCVGPVLAAILFVAGTEDSVGHGAALLGSYAAGIGLPFLAATLFAGSFLRLMSRLRGAMGIVEKVLGALLVGTGILFIVGGMAEIAYWILEAFPALGRIG
jgi:cytochrome c-type biogenesis protein